MEGITSSFAPTKCANNFMPRKCELTTKNNSIQSVFVSFPIPFVSALTSGNVFFASFYHISAILGNTMFERSFH